MENKIITMGLGSIILFIFIIFFINQNLIFDRGNRMNEHLNEIRQAIISNDWGLAKLKFNEFNNIWNEGKYLIPINNAEQEYLNFVDHIKNLEGAIITRDESSGVVATLKLEGDWKNFKKIVPSP